MGDTFEFEDQASVDRLIGTLRDPGATTGHVLTVQADKSIKAVAGGGSQPVFAQYTGSPVTIADGGSAQMPFNFLALGTELLDRTDPEFPTFLEDGFYIVSWAVACDTAFTPGGGGVAYINDDLAEIEGVNLQFNIGTSPQQAQNCSFGPQSAGGNLNVTAINQDGGGTAHQFSLTGLNIAKLA